MIGVYCILCYFLCIGCGEAKPRLVCDHRIRLVELEYGLPDYLLCSITHVESGARQLPWQLNANGFPFALNSKEQAIRAVNVLQDIGLQSIDVGLAQINLKHHPKAFAKIENAFEPNKNLAYAAKFLLRLKKRQGSWERAICAYHSSTPKYGIRYKNRVLKAWRSFLGKEPNFAESNSNQALMLKHQKRLLKLKETLDRSKNGQEK